MDLIDEDPPESLTCSRCFADVKFGRGRVYSRAVFCDTCSYHINMQILRWHEDGRRISHQALADKLEISIANVYKRISRLGIGTRILWSRQ